MTSCVVNTNGSWNHYLSRFIFLPESDDSNYDKLHVYPKIQFRETRITLEQFWSILERIETKGELAVPGLPSVATGNTVSRYPGIRELYQSGERSFGLDWPAQVYATIPRNNMQVSLQNDHLVAIDQPLYDSPQRALKDVFGFETGHISLIGTVLFVVPNYIAKINGILIGPRKIELGVVIGKETHYSDLLAKVYVESGDATEQKDVEVTGPSIQAQLGLDADHCLAYLFSRNGNEILDYRQFGISWSIFSNDITFETTPENLEQLIARGESKQVEFKAAMPKRWEEFAETVVAMSNGDGGTILLGVDDNGSVVGVEDSKITDSIHEVIRNYCEPSIEPMIDVQMVRGKRVAAVQIAKGEKRPYVLKGRGAYVRFGATDRIASRDEIIELVSRPPGGFGFA